MATGAAAYEICTSGCRAGIPGSGNGQFDETVTLETDPDGDVYVADRYNSRAEKFTGTGTYLCQWGAPAALLGMATDADGCVYVCDSHQNQIRKFCPEPVSIEATSWGRIKSNYR